MSVEEVETESRLSTSEALGRLSTIEALALFYNWKPITIY